MSVVHLLRHAEAAKASGQSEADLFSIADLGLSARGVLQAAAAQETLRGAPLDAVYASPARRARETARALATPRGLEVQVDARLRELPVGGVDYPAMLEAILALPERFVTPPGPFLEERRAFAEAMEEVAARHEASAVVAHALSIGAFLCAAMGRPPEELLAVAPQHAERFMVERRAGAWVVR